LIIKKRYRPDFKKIVLDENLTILEKLELLDNQYLDDFEKLEELANPLIPSPFPLVEKGNIEKIIKILQKLISKPDLYYDALK